MNAEKTLTRLLKHLKEKKFYYEKQMEDCKERNLKHTESLYRHYLHITNDTLDFIYQGVNFNSQNVLAGIPNIEAVEQ